MKATAALLSAPAEPLRIEEIDLAEPGFGEVRVRMLASGVCHSDYRVLRGEWGAKMPIVLGHEGAGVIDAIGPGVAGLAGGDLVALSWTPSCGACRYCLSGRPQLCVHARANAYSNVMPDGTTRLSRGGEPVYSYLSVGSFAEYAIVPRSGAIKIPPHVDPRIAALVGCAITTGVGAAVNTQPITAGATALVIGAGGVGQSVIAGLNLQSPSMLIAVDIVDERLKAAKRIGATHTINSSEADVRETVLELTEGAGVEFAYEATGRSEAIEQAYSALASGGVCTVVGQVASGSTINIDPLALSGRELVLRGSNYGSSRPAIDFPRILALHEQGRLDLNALVTKTIRIDEINEAFDDMRAGIGLRTVVTFG